MITKDLNYIWNSKRLMELLAVVFMTVIFMSDMGMAVPVEVYNVSAGVEGVVQHSDNQYAPNRVTYDNWIHQGHGTIQQVIINFNTLKVIDTMSFNPDFSMLASGYQEHAAGAQLVATNENEYVVFMVANVSGQYYGQGIIGWQRTYGNQFKYDIRFTNVDETYAKTLTGYREMHFTYDERVYTDYLNQGLQSVPGCTAGANKSDILYAQAIVSISTNQCSVKMGGTTGVTTIKSKFDNYYTVTAKNLTNTFSIINITRRGYNSEVYLRNVSGGNIISNTSTLDLSYIVNITRGLIVHIYDLNALVWRNFSVYNAQGAISNPNELIIVSTNKTYYNISELPNITYRVDNADTYNYVYRVKVYDESGAYFTGTTLNGYAGIPTITTLSGNFYPSSIAILNQPHIFTVWVTKSPINTTNYFMNYTSFNYGTFNAVGIGNLSTDKTVYNTTETMNIYYNISQAGRLVVRDSSSNHWFIPVVAGNNQTADFYISSADKIGAWSISLEYFDGALYPILNTTYVSIISNTNNRIDFDKTQYLYFETISITSYSNSSGYITVTDSGNNIRLNYTITPNGIQSRTLYISSLINEGVITARMYNLEDLTATYTAIISHSIVTPAPTDTTPTATVTGTPGVTCEGSSVLDAGSCISEQVIGKMTDENGEVTDIQIRKTGNKLFGVLLMLVLIVIIIGIVKMGKK